MSVIATFSRLLIARQAVQYLASRGVRSEIIGETDPYGGALGYRLWVPTPAIADAKALIAELAALPPADPGWEDQSRPDLSRLAPSIAPPCPECGHTLPLDANAKTCPACGAAVDIVALIVATKGPEALIPAYPDVAPLSDPIDLRDRHLKCPACGYDLEGLANAGVCPECGAAYSKHLILGDLSS